MDETDFSVFPSCVHGSRSGAYAAPSCHATLARRQVFDGDPSVGENVPRMLSGLDCPEKLLVSLDQK